MEEKVRKTAIDIIGDVPWGTHFCQFYQTKEDLIDTLVPYFKAGLKNNEFCMWITAEPLNAEDAERALKKKVKDLDDYIKKGQIEILDFSQWYVRSGRFDSDQVLQGWVEKEQQALEKGFDGLRLSGNTFWLEKKDWKNFTDYEAAVNSVIDKHRMLAICTYCLDKCTASEIMDVLSNHQFAVIKREGKWEIIESAEHKKTAEALRESEEKFRNLAEQSPNMIFINKGGRIVYANERCEQVVGYKREEFYSPDFDFLTLIVEQHRESIKANFKKHTLGQEVLPLESTLITKEGRRIDSILTTKLIQYGGETAILGIVTDITERKMAQENISRQKKLLENTLESLPHPFYVIDPKDYTIKLANAATFAYGSLSETSTCYALTHKAPTPCRGREHPCPLEQVVKTKKPAIVEHIHCDKDGNDRNVEVHAYPVLDSAGNLIQVIEYCLDISEQKQAVEALKAEKEFMETVLNTQTDTFFVFEPSTGKAVRWNKAFNRISGYTDEEIRSKKAPDSYYSEQDLKKATAATEKIFKKGSASVELSLITKDGRSIPTEYTGSLIRDDQGSPKYIIAVGRDITERKRAQAQIENLARFPSENPNPVLRITKDGVLLYANDSSTSLLAEWDCSVGQVVPDKWCQTVSEVFATQSAKRVEVEHAGKTFAFMVVPVIEGEYANLYARDITERKQAQERVQNLAKFPSENPFPVLRIAEDGSILYSNNASLALLAKWERQVGESTPHDWCQLIGDVLHSNRNKIIEVKYGKSIISFVFAPVAKAGYVNIYGRDVTKQKKAEQALQKAHNELEKKVQQRTAELSRTVGMLQEEVRERTIAQQALQQSEARLRDAQRIAHIGNWDWDIVNNQLWWSDEIYRIFGLEPQEFNATYETFLSHVHPHDREFVKKSVNEALYEHKPYSIDHRIVRPDGTERIVHEQAEVIHNANNSPVRMRGTVQDVTAQKQAEEKILDDQKQLRSLTAELLLSEERERRKIARDLHDSVGQILAFSDRELGTLQKSAPEKLMKFVEEIRHHIKQAVKQTRTLTFDLSPPALYDLGFEAAVEELAEQFSKETKIECRFDSCDQHKLIADHIKILLYRSIRELLTNVVKHSKARLVRITSSRVNNDLQITVEDDGTGFDISKLEPKAGNSRGFGLFSIRERLTHIGGQLDVQSSNGKGTKITLLVPLKPKKIKKRRIRL